MIDKKEIISMMNNEAENAYRDMIQHQVEELKQMDKNNTKNADYEYIQRMIAHGKWTILSYILMEIENREGK